MCARYSLTSPPEAVRALFSLGPLEAFPPRYNIAPTQPIGLVRHNVQGNREWSLARWGLMPSWVKEPRTFSTLINARSETAAEKPSFRGALRHRRCLIPADAYYEWTGAAKAKQPHRIAPRSGGLFSFAGLWESWLGADGSEFDSAAILTTRANAALSVLHDRMPVIVAPEHFDVWLDCRSGTSEGVLGLFEPTQDDAFDHAPVSRRLNNSRNEGPEVLEPL